MGRRSKHVAVLENLVCVSLKHIRSLGLFKSDGYARVPIKIQHRNGLLMGTHTLLITASIQDEPYLKIEGIINRKPVVCTLPLEKFEIKSTGYHTFYLKCPVAGKRVKNVYLYNGSFISRQGIHGVHYLRNTLSKKNRILFEQNKRLMKLEAEVADIARKRFKRTWQGRPTKCMLQVLNAQKQLRQLRA